MAGLTAMVKLAKLFNLPTIITTNQPDSTYGPTIDIVTETLPDATVIDRMGELDPFDNNEFK